MPKQDEPLHARRMAPATDRNRDAILDVLRRVLPSGGLVLEIASGTGQHAAYFAAALPALTWQPSDPEPAARASIEGWTAHAGLANVLPPLALDVRRQPWGIEAAQALVCINMVHIAPWAAAEALFAGAARLLPAGGVLYLYGPYRRNGEHTAPSNAAFDAQLRSADAQWGVRDMEDIVVLGEAAGLRMDDPIPMPANNFSLVFRK
ncbi:DUF938 domain-containing protein [Cupriavidus sp. 2TAF22]|uniref:DUF938 domain-containing protein n=1 Tax=unclassified Cupriavidus TaxID=2640874 RepID=UPI003F934AFC